MEDKCHKKIKFIINNLIASISSLEIRRTEDNKKIIASDLLSLDLEQLNSSDKKILVNSISNEGSFIDVNRNKLSQFDIEELFVLQKLNHSVGSTNHVCLLYTSDAADE